MRESVHGEYEMLALFEMTPDLVCIASKEGYFIKVNPAVIKTLQYDPEEIYSRPISTFLHPEDHELTRRERNRLLEGKTLLNFQNRYLTKHGDTIWLEWTSLYIPEKEIVFAIAKNITANKIKEEEFAGKIKTYKNLARHFKSRAEEDRRSLAYELHEEVAQLAAALKWQTEMIQNKMSGISNETVLKLEEIISISDRLVKAIRRISFSISPSMLYDLGFSETMEYACREFAILTGINCEYSCDLEDEELSTETKTDLFRTCQQVLSIISEQEDISSVAILLEKTADGIAVNIQSDGKGIPHDKGLMSIRQLATSINARVALAEEDGKGTKIILLDGGD